MVDRNCGPNFRKLLNCQSNVRSTFLANFGHISTPLAPLLAPLPAPLPAPLCCSSSSCSSFLLLVLLLFLAPLPAHLPAHLDPSRPLLAHLPAPLPAHLDTLLAFHLELEIVPKNVFLRILGRSHAIDPATNHRKISLNEHRFGDPNSCPSAGFLDQPEIKKWKCIMSAPISVRSYASEDNRL